VELQTSIWIMARPVMDALSGTAVNALCGMSMSLQLQLEVPTKFQYTDRMKNKKTFEEVMTEFKALETGMQHMVRNTAKLELKEWGVEEIGSSDVNCQIVDLYNSYGSFDEVIRHGMELVRSH